MSQEMELEQAREDRRKHLELIQGVINRLAGNSFHLKGWAVTLVSALTALGAQDSKASYMLLALIPVIAFWPLDAYFLREERRFRELYGKVSKQPTTNFAMSREDLKKETLDEVMARATLLGFYGVLFITVLVVAGLTYKAG